MTGHVYRRTDITSANVWVTRWRGPDGRQRKRSFPSEALAREFLADLLAGRTLPPPPRRGFEEITRFSIRNGMSGHWLAPRWRHMVRRCHDPGSPDFALDRIDNDRGYRPGNLRWADWHQQAASRRARRWFRAPAAGR